MKTEHAGSDREDRRRAYDPEQRRSQPARAAHTTGYRTDADRHEAARDLVPANRRREIAALGGLARAATYHGPEGIERWAPRNGHTPPTAPPTTPPPLPKPPPPPAQAPTYESDLAHAKALTALAPRVLDPRTAAIARLATGKATPAEIKAAAAKRAADTRPARRKAAAAAKRPQP